MPVWSRPKSRVEILGSDSSGLRKEISDYADEASSKPRYDNDSELVAEAFAFFWYNGPGQNQLVDAIIDALLRRIG